jgi:nitrite reductase/ring-hydroxylating ferredoxin subunit
MSKSRAFLRACLLLTTSEILALGASAAAVPTMSDVQENGRRNFCLHAWRAASWLALGSIIEACGGGGTRSLHVTGFDNTNYVCPCYGSKFTTAGRVINGPANAPLRTFATPFANNVLTISI